MSKFKYDEQFLANFRALADRGMSARQVGAQLGLTLPQTKYVAEAYSVRFSHKPGPSMTLAANFEELGPAVERDRHIRQLEDDNSALRRKYEEARKSVV